MEGRLIPDFTECGLGGHPLFLCIMDLNQQGLIVEATNAFLDGDLGTGKRLLRDYLNATGAMEAVARELRRDEKSIRRMVGPRGNPTLTNFLNLLNSRRRRENLALRVCG